MMPPTLEEYLRSAQHRGVIDFSIRARLDENGIVVFYIHPANTSGDTLDFAVTGNSLTLHCWAQSHFQSQP